jgi:hypothetical protein
LSCVSQEPVQQRVQCSSQLDGGTLQLSLQCMSHCALAWALQSATPPFIVHCASTGTSHSAWQPLKQSSRAGLHSWMHLVPQLLVQLLCVAIAVHPPWHAAVTCSGEHLAEHPPDTSILHERPSEKSKVPQGPRSVRSARAGEAVATTTRAAVNAEIRERVFMRPPVITTSVPRLSFNTRHNAAGTRTCPSTRPWR